ncbi:MAG TPA: AlpA family phage regulatory protein [Acidocella sp.]|jgi:prophage regulatory protein|nr:AlpA family phage regulatory protein [Acidocella sp.]
MSETTSDLVLLDIHEVRARVSLGTSTIYRMMDAGTFPSSVSLAPRTVRWLKSEIDDWIAEKAAARRPTGAPAAQDRRAA